MTACTTASSAALLGRLISCNLLLFDEELANEDLVNFTPLPESEPEEDSGFDFCETEDEEEAAAEDDELSQAAIYGQFSNHRLG